MGVPVVIASNGYGTPVTIATNGYGLPVEIASNGIGMPVVLVASGGMPVVGSFGPDVTAPLAVSFSPTDNATGVNTATLLIVTFDSLVTLGTGNVTLKKASDNSTVEAWDVATEAGTGAGQVSVEFSTQLTMRLTTSIAGGTEYYVIWDANVVKDVANNPVAANASTTLWSFTTAAAAGYDAATEAIAAAFTTPPTTARKNLIDAAVVALKSAGVWTKLDALYLFAAADSQAAKINWKAPGTFNATEVNAPAFTADSGFLGAATKSIDSGFNPSTAPSPNFVQNSAMIAGWALTDFNEPGAGHSMVLATTGTWNLLQQRAGNAYWIGVNSSNYATGASADGSGLWALSRTSSGSISLYRNGSLVNAHSITSEAVPTTTWRFVNDWPGVMAGGALASQLSAADNTALYNALRTYLTGVGVP